MLLDNISIDDMDDLGTISRLFLLYLLQYIIRYR